MRAFKVVKIINGKFISWADHLPQAQEYRIASATKQPKGYQPLTAFASLEAAEEFLRYGSSNYPYQIFECSITQSKIKKPCLLEYGLWDSLAEYITLIKNAVKNGNCFAPHKTVFCTSITLLKPVSEVRYE